MTMLRARRGPGATRSSGRRCPAASRSGPGRRGGSRSSRSSRVADERDLRARLVGADHVRAGRDLLGAVAGDLLAVERQRVLARHRRGQRQHERRGERAAGRAAQLEHDRVLVRRRDAGDLRARLGARLRADEVAEVGGRVRVVDGLKKPRSIAYLRSAAVDLALDRRREVHAGAQLDRDGLAVGGDGRRRDREVGARVGAARLVGHRRALGDVGDHVAAGVVRLAGVDRVDVARPRHGQRAAALGGSLGGVVGGVRRAAAGEQQRRQRRGNQES